MRRLPIALLALLVLTAPAHAAPVRLEPGKGRFWLGGQIESGDVGDPSLCDVVAPCPVFELEVAPGGELLRVAYDTPSRTNSFDIELTGPDGHVTTAAGSNVFNAEARVADPPAGRWKVRVIPRGVRHARIRLRAMLEGPAPAPGARRPLLPNLRAVPPYELGFVAPANPANAVYPPDTVNPPLEVAGEAPLSCTADEMAPPEAGGGGAVDCLRLTSGPMNVGDGPFMKRFFFLSDLTGGKLETGGPYIRGEAHQTIAYSDGTTESRPAGTYSFHTTHAHFHDDGILTYELFRVAGPDLVPAGGGTKSGFCPADQLMGIWRAFSQDAPGTFGEGDTFGGSCYGATDDGLLALTRGWGDVYRWQRPGQYVEFSGNGDGLYVVRTTVDKADTTLETVETDNSAYALVRISGREPRLLERGWGLSHMDPAKVVFEGFGPASQDPFGGAVPDSEPPRVRRVRLLGRFLRFGLSERATVRITVLRDGRSIRRRTVTRPRGSTRLRLGLVPGRYRVALAATDAAGNAAAPVRIRQRLSRSW